jgi:hypothetical protein
MAIDATSAQIMVNTLNTMSSYLVNSSGLATMPATTSNLLNGYISNITNSSGVLNAASGATLNAQITNLINWGTSVAAFSTSATVSQSSMTMVGNFVNSLLASSEAGSKISS